MPIMIFALLAVLVLAVVVIAVVVMGMEGTGRDKHPEIADAMARTARHLNGEGEPPKALRTLFDEIDDVPQVAVRDLPQKLRSMRSARSATSAASADLPDEAAGQHPGSATGWTASGRPATQHQRKRAAATADPEASSASEPASLEAQQAPPADGADLDPDVTVAKPDPLLAGVATRAREGEPDAEDPQGSASGDGPVQRSGKRKRNRTRNGRPATAVGPDTNAAAVLDPAQDRMPSASERQDAMGAALAEPAVTDLHEADPYGVWGADDVAEMPELVHPRIHLGRRHG